MLKPFIAVQACAYNEEAYGRHPLALFSFLKLLLHQRF